MLNINRVEIIGNLGREPLIRETKAGGKIAVLNVATTERWVRDGQDFSRTEWHLIKVLSPGAVTYIEQYAKKGNLVRLEGHLHTSKFEKDGATRYATEVVVGAKGSFSLLTPRSAPATASAGDTVSDQEPASPEAEDRAPSNGKEVNGQDVPF